MWTLTDEEYEDLTYKAEAYEWMSDFMYDQVWDVHDVMCDDPTYRVWLGKWEPESFDRYYGEVED